MNVRISQIPPAGLSTLFALSFLLAAATCAVSQSASDLSILGKHINKEVTVETTDGRVSGQLLRVEDSRIVIYNASGPKPIAWASVRSVTKHKSRLTAAWVVGMTAAGIGTGFLLGLNRFDDATGANGKVGVAAAAGAGAGAAAGFALSRTGKRDEVIYRSEK